MANLFARVGLVCFILFLLDLPLSAQLRKVYLDSDSSNVINQTSFISASEGYVAFTKWIGHTTDSGRTFTKLYVTTGNVNYNGFSPNLTFGFGIAGVKAFTTNTLIAYGNYGLIPAILYSTNGGAGWTLVFLSQYASLDFNGGITDMLFPADNNTGYAVDADRILKTTNGGQSWAVVNTVPNSFFNHLEAVDNNTVFALNTGPQLNIPLRTTNGGTSWAPMPMPAMSGIYMNYMYFLDANTGWMNLSGTSNDGYLFKTINAGASWTLQNNTTATPFFCSKMHFVDANTGYALVAPFQVYKTLNSGALWEPLPRDNGYTYLNYTLNDLQCWSASQLWAGGGHGYLELSTNGGGTPIPTAYFSIDTTGEYSTGVVHLNNFSNPAYQSHWYVNDTLVSSSYNSTYIHSLSRSSDTISLIVSSNGISDTLTQVRYFTVTNLPVISSFTPVAGGAGTVVSINGSGFSGATSVSFGGTPAVSFTIVSDKLITATVGSGATGAVGVGIARGTAFTPGFTWIPSPAAPPVITSVFPVSGPVGTTVTIGGSGFNSQPSANKVSFGSIKATIQSASPSGIVCTVPAGASFNSIFVTNTTNGLTAQTPLPFNVTFPDSSNFTPNSFSTVFSDVFPAYTAIPQALLGSDLDGDGKPDLIVNMYLKDSMAVYRNTSSKGNISFAPRINIFSVFNNGNNGGFAANDLDGDGLPDIAYVTNAAQITIARNQSTPGKISFGYPIGLSTPNGTEDLVVTDLDGDGRNDIAVACYQGDLSILRNTGAPGTLAFAAPQNLPVSLCLNVSAGDLDGDGKKDIIAMSGSGVLSIFRNASTPGNISMGSGAATTLAIGGVSYLTLADFDGDGHLDIIAATQNNVNIYRNISTPGNIAFAPAILIPNGNLSAGSAMANFGGGYLPDIVSTFSGLGYLGLHRNTSTPGMITAADNVSVSLYSPYFATASDFDGDGKPDIAISQEYDDGGTTFVLRNGISGPIKFGVCGQTPATLISNVSGSQYQWQRDVGSGFVAINDNDTLTGTQTSTLTFNRPPRTWNGYQYRCFVDGSQYSNVYILGVDTSSSPGIVLKITDSTICYGISANFFASDSKGDTTYTFTWLVNGAPTGTSTTNRFQSATLQNKDKVQAILLYTNTCGSFADTSLPISVTVLPAVTPAISLSVQDTLVCSGAQVVFVAHPSNGGANPSYQWWEDGKKVGTNDSTYTTSGLTAASTVYVTLMSNVSCSTKDTAVSDPAVLGIDTSAIQISGDSLVAAGQSITVTATVKGAGGDPGYQWQYSTDMHTWKNINGGTGSSVTYTPDSTGNQIRCIVTSVSGCADTSNRITFTVSSGQTNIRYYPNPAMSTLTIQNSLTADGMASVTVTSAIGGRYLTLDNLAGQNKVVLDVAPLSRGVYFVTVRRLSGGSTKFAFVKM